MSQPLEYPRRPPSSAELICDDGEPMESARHWQQMVVLVQSLELGWKHRDDFYVGGNMFLYFSETQARKNDFRGPDVFVVLNTNQRERRAWVVWEEDGKTPDVIIELLSESTEKVDRGEKKRVYERQLKVGEYFLFDPFSGVLEGYELDVLHGHYVPKVPDAQGRLRCEQMDLWLGKATGIVQAVEAEWLRWMDAAGRVLPTPWRQPRPKRAAPRPKHAAPRPKHAAPRPKPSGQNAKPNAPGTKPDAPGTRPSARIAWRRSWRPCGANTPRTTDSASDVCQGHPALL